MMNMMNRALKTCVTARALSLTVLAVLAATACGTSEKTSWEQALQQNTPESYRQFIQRYPQGRFLQSARERFAGLDSEAWTNAVSEKNGDSALRQYLHFFPDGAHAAKATAVLELEAVLAQHFLPEAEQVRAAIIVALRQRYPQAASAEFTLGSRMVRAVDRRIGRSLVLCSVSRKDVRGRVELLATEGFLESPLVFDVRRSNEGVWSAIVGESLWVQDALVTDEMTVLSPTPIQLKTGEWGQLAVVWKRQTP